MKIRFFSFCQMIAQWPIGPPFIIVAEIWMEKLICISFSTCLTLQKRSEINFFHQKNYNIENRHISSERKITKQNASLTCFPYLLGSSLNKTLFKSFFCVKCYYSLHTYAEMQIHVYDNKKFALWFSTCFRKKHESNFLCWNFAIWQIKFFCNSKSCKKNFLYFKGLYYVSHKRNQNHTMFF